MEHSYFVTTPNNITLTPPTSSLVNTWYPIFTLQAGPRPVKMMAIRFDTNVFNYPLYVLVTKRNGKATSWGSIVNGPYTQNPASALSLANSTTLQMASVTQSGPGWGPLTYASRTWTVATGNQYYVTIYDPTRAGDPGGTLTSYCTSWVGANVGKPGYVLIGSLNYGFSAPYTIFGNGGLPVITPFSESNPVPGFSCAFNYFTSSGNNFTAYPSNSDKEVMIMTAGSLGLTEWEMVTGNVSLESNDRGSIGA